MKKIKSKKSSAFTLIELLAVIIILGVLMIIAIPSVTEYIQSSRKQAYVNIALQYIDGARNKVNAAEFPMYDLDTTYYLPASCISLEKGGDSPFGEFSEAYVVVTYDGTGFDYYWTSYDTAKMGIVLTYRDLLKAEYVESGISSINTSIGVGERANILLISNDCNMDNAISKLSVESINEHGRYTTAMYVNDEEEFKEAFNDSKIVNIFLEKDLEISSSMSIIPSNNDEQRLIRINGNGHTIKYKDGYNSTMFNIPEKTSVRFDNIIINGENQWTYGNGSGSGDGWYADYIYSNGGEVKDYIFKNSGTLSLGNNVIIKDLVFDSGSSNYNGDLGVISSSSGEVIIDGANINNCAGLFINAVNTKVEIKGNTVIENNFGTGNKGGMFIINNSIAVIDGNAKVNNNRVIVRSGAIFGLVNNSTLTMSGGQINNNLIEVYGSNTAGAMIVLESGSGMVMNGGEIVGNIGALSGAIASRWNSGSYGTSEGIFLNGGTIKNNTTLGTGWSNATIFLRSAATIGENMKIDGIVVVNSDGVLENKGTINGNLILSAANAVVNNSGKVNGNVTITNANAQFNNTGIVTGSITRP